MKENIAFAEKIIKCVLTKENAVGSSEPTAFYMERVKGVEPSSSAWKADVLAVVRHPH